ncbi:hypothetical protein A374_12785 [Fictibacillus macauensis ZFHKF-1]|uniref:YugN-like family protein n=1 Tax=Fictibacillus macauensis ZFHKF-1 TaxID=1196324 RepID=I8AGV4_9BACL|nr:YugN family protein [Fictibacillus macauensis]EIT84922.1 hypothetical protein A374_12785 [Fictibacillus macauensis ZFHKF-1]
MQFEESRLNGKVLPFSMLEHIMHQHGIIRAGQWDYERITYDYKFEDMTNGDVYYLRIPCRVVEGEVERAHAKIEVLNPYLGKHYYPHGVEYNEEFPKNIVKHCKKLIDQIAAEIH